MVTQGGPWLGPEPMGEWGTWASPHLFQLPHPSYLTQDPCTRLDSGVLFLSCKSLVAPAVIAAGVRPLSWGMKAFPKPEAGWPWLRQALSHGSPSSAVGGLRSRRDGRTRHTNIQQGPRVEFAFSDDIDVQTRGL